MFGAKNGIKPMNERDKRRATRKQKKKEAKIHVVKKQKNKKYETRRNNTRKEVEIEGEKRKKKYDKTERTQEHTHEAKLEKKIRQFTVHSVCIVVLTRFISQKHFRTYEQEKKKYTKRILAKENSAIHQQITKQTN